MVLCGSRYLNRVVDLGVDNNITIGTLFRIAEVLGLDIEFKPKTRVKP